MLTFGGTPLAMGFMPSYHYAARVCRSYAVKYKIECCKHNTLYKCRINYIHCADKLYADNFMTD